MDLYESRKKRNKRFLSFILVGTIAANINVMSSSMRVGDEEKEVSPVYLTDYYDEDVKKYREDLMNRITDGGSSFGGKTLGEETNKTVGKVYKKIKSNVRVLDI